MVTNDLHPIEVPAKYGRSFVALENIDVYFMETCSKMSEKRRLQKRVIVVIRDHVYSCYEDGSITRCIRTPDIRGLYVRDGDVVLRIPGDQDLWLRLPSGVPASKLTSILSQLYEHATNTPLPITHVHTALDDPHHPVNLVKRDRPIYLDPMTQPEPPLEQHPTVEASIRHTTRGPLTLPNTSYRAFQPAPPEDDLDDATGVAVSGSLVPSGTIEDPTVEMTEAGNGTTNGVVTLTQEQLNNAQGGPIKINFQIKSRDSVASSRASTVPAPPSRSTSAYSLYEEPAYAGQQHPTPATRYTAASATPSAQPSVPRSVTQSVPHSVPQSVPHSVPQSVPQSVPHPVPQSVPQSMPHSFPPSVPQSAAPSVQRSEPQPVAEQSDPRIPQSQHSIACSAKSAQQYETAHTMTEGVQHTQSGTQMTVPNTPVEQSIGTSPALPPQVQMGTQMSQPSQVHANTSAPVQQRASVPMQTSSPVSEVGLPEKQASMQSLPSLHPVTPLQQPSQQPSLVSQPRRETTPMRQPPTPVHGTPRQTSQPAGLGARLVGQDQWDMGPLIVMTVPTHDGTVQTVQVPEACVPNVQALVEQIQEAQENLVRKDQQLTAVLNLTQKNTAAKKGRTEDRLHSLMEQIHGAELELERVRDQLQDTKTRLVREKEAHLEQLTAQVQAVQRPQPQMQHVQQYAHPSPGARLPQTSPVRSPEGMRVSPQRVHNSQKPRRQYSHSPLQGNDQENDWAMMSRICQDISQRIDNTKVVQSPQATEAKRQIANQFSPLPKLAPR